MKVRQSLTMLALLFALVATGGATEPRVSALEVLDPATARAEIARSEGLVLVDLYADW